MITIKKIDWTDKIDVVYCIEIKINGKRKKMLAFQTASERDNEIKKLCEIIIKGEDE